MKLARARRHRHASWAHRARSRTRQRSGRRPAVLRARTGRQRSQDPHGHSGNRIEGGPMMPKTKHMEKPCSSPEAASSIPPAASTAKWMSCCATAAWLELPAPGVLEAARPRNLQRQGLHRSARLRRSSRASARARTVTQGDHRHRAPPPLLPEASPPSAPCPTPAR